jgi:predicted  nucleic acid-binding Zn-ribbon protein
MAGPAPNFLQQFQEAFNKINAELETRVNNNVRQKNQFVETLFTNLKDINNKTKLIYSRIQQVIARLNDLQREYERNDGMIERTEREITGLRNEIAGLNEAIRNIQGREAEIQRQHLASVDKLTAQIRTLTQQNQVLKQEAEALQRELANRPGQEQNAAALKELAEHYEQQMQQAAEANQRQIDALNQQIAEETQKNAAHQATIANHAGQIDAFNQQIAEHQKNLADATTTRDNLTLTNADLEDRIKQATGALQKAEGYIQQLLTTRPSDADQQEYAAILGEIQGSLDQINGIIPSEFRGTTGSSGSPGSPSGLASGLAGLFGTSSPSPPASPSDRSFGLGPGVTNDQPTSRTARTNTGIPARNVAIPGRSGMPGQGNLSNQAPGGVFGPDDNATLGGKKLKKTKKTKKNRKQKGGFIYKNKRGGYVIINQSKKNTRKSGTRSRRTGSRSSRSSSRSTSRSTSRNSSY